MHYEWKIEEEQNILLSGLAKEKTNYDLLYNLAYTYEIEENYLQAIIYYSTLQVIKFP